MAMTAVQAGGRVILPADVREAAGIKTGDLLDAEITAEGILLRLSGDIDPDQSWYWTEEWQAGEREVDADLAADRATVFRSGEAFLAALHKRAKAGSGPTAT